MILNCGKWLSIRYINGLGLLTIEALLAFTLYDQIFLEDLPCPLCLLQRLGFTACMVALFLNVIYGPKPWHYALLLFSGLFGAAVALRQISLHVIPGTPPYGNEFFSLHFYTWAFIAFVTVLVLTSFLLLIPSQDDNGYVPFAGHPLWVRCILCFGILVISLNMVLALLECGFWTCESSPQSYRLL